MMYIKMGRFKPAMHRRNSIRDLGGPLNVKSAYTEGDMVKLYTYCVIHKCSHKR